MNISELEQEKTKKVLELKSLYESNQISHSEYVELVEDELDFEKIAKMLDTEEKKILAEKAFLAIKSIAGIIK